MTRRFRMIAGPNGSGKSTLVAWLKEAFAVNFYTFLNADDILLSLRKTNAYFPNFPVDHADLVNYAESSTYDESVKDIFRNGKIRVDGDCVRFDADAINSYTVALLTNFLQYSAIRRGESFSQETVFSHPSKIAALKDAKECGYRTYLYFVATEMPSINLQRVRNRHSQGGHDVPDEKIAARYARSIAQVRSALPYLSRAFFFDNSGAEMRYLASYSDTSGFAFNGVPFTQFPNWFSKIISSDSNTCHEEDRKRI